MKILKQLSKLSKQLTEERYCLASNHSLHNESWSHLLTDVSLCSECLLASKPILKRFKVNQYSCLSLYKYESPLSDWLIRYKQQNDICLSPLFLTPFKWMIKFLYPNYIIVPAPSTFSAIEKRGFSHMYEIAKTLDMPIYDILRKRDGYDQKGKNFQGRMKIRQNIYINDKIELKGRKILLLDDVFTTGATLISSFQQLEKLKPKKLKGLVIMKV